MTDLTPRQREILTKKVREWRIEAEPYGTLHANWDLIFDGEALLAGRETFLPRATLMEMWNL